MERRAGATRLLYIVQPRGRMPHNSRVAKVTPTNACLRCIVVSINYLRTPAYILRSLSLSQATPAAADDGDFNLICVSSI